MWQAMYSPLLPSTATPLLHSIGTMYMVFTIYKLWRYHSIHLETRGQEVRVIANCDWSVCLQAVNASGQVGLSPRNK